MVNRETWSGSGKVVQEYYDLLAEIWVAHHQPCMSLSFEVDNDMLNSAEVQQTENAGFLESNVGRHFYQHVHLMNNLIGIITYLHTYVMLSMINDKSMSQS